jgi:hypothetical protein
LTKIGKAFFIDIDNNDSTGAGFPGRVYQDTVLSLVIEGPDE